MADFVKLAATAERLINANGRTVTVVQQGNTPADVDKPWRSATTTARASVSGKAVFVSSSDLGYVVNNPDNVKRAEQVALFSANDDGGRSLEDFDLIVDGSVNWKITHAEVLAPADTRIMYLFEVNR